MAVRSEAIQKRIPLHESLMQLASILEYAEANDGVIPDDLMPALKGTEAAVMASVDRRVEVLRTCENALMQLCEMQDAISERKGKLEKVIASVRERTYQEMTFAEVKKIQGTLATFSIDKSGQRSVKWLVGLQKLSDIIDPIDVSKVDESYITKMTIFHFDTKKYAQDFRSGKIIPLFDSDLWDVSPEYGMNPAGDDDKITTQVATLMPKGTHLKVKIA